jgi:DNA-binding SARP family transcriptional activator
MASTLRIQFLGEFHLVTEGEQPAHLKASGSSGLGVSAVASSGAPISPTSGFFLWPPSTDAQARANLRNLLHILRQARPDLNSF